MTRFPNEEDAEMKRADNVSLWRYPLILKLVRNVARVAGYPSANFGDTTTICFNSDLWAIGRCARRPLGAIDRSPIAANCIKQRWGTFVPNLGTLGLRVLELFAMYATNGRTDRRTDGRTDKSKAYCPLPYGRRHNNKVRMSLQWHQPTAIMLGKYTFAAPWYQHNVKI